MTYKQIIEVYKQHYNQTIKSCWIADVKRQMGLEVRRAYNRAGDLIINKCPPDKAQLIMQIINGEI